MIRKTLIPAMMASLVLAAGCSSVAPTASGAARPSALAGANADHTSGSVGGKIVLPWPNTSGLSDISAIDKSNVAFSVEAFRYAVGKFHLRDTPTIASVVPSRDVLNDAVAICRLWETNDDFRLITDTVEAQGYRFPNGSKQAAAKMMHGAALANHLSHEGL